MITSRLATETELCTDSNPCFLYYENSEGRLADYKKIAANGGADVYVR